MKLVSRVTRADCRAASGNAGATDCAAGAIGGGFHAAQDRGAARAGPLGRALPYIVARGRPAAGLARTGPAEHAHLAGAAVGGGGRPLDAPGGARAGRLGWRD